MRLDSSRSDSVNQSGKCLAVVSAISVAVVTMKFEEHQKLSGGEATVVVSFCFNEFTNFCFEYAGFGLNRVKSISVKYFGLDYFIKVLLLSRLLEGLWI